MPQCIVGIGGGASALTWGKVKICIAWPLCVWSVIIYIIKTMQWYRLTHTLMLPIRQFGYFIYYYLIPIIHLSLTTPKWKIMLLAALHHFNISCYISLQKIWTFDIERKWENGTLIEACHCQWWYTRCIYNIRNCIIYCHIFKRIAKSRKTFISI